MGAPGSFYSHLFPANTLNSVHSNYSLQWLSRVPPAPCNEEGLPITEANVYISKTSPPTVAKSYLAQSEEDFSFFLKCRSVELVLNGHMVTMVLSFRGRPSVDPHVADDIEDKVARAETLANIIRSHAEASASHYFGAHIIDTLYAKLAS
ncbi:hypothetical protein Ancab_000925 [Ancistrocladus abbreviatus]